MKKTEIKKTENYKKYYNWTENKQTGNSAPCHHNRQTPEVDTSAEWKRFYSGAV